MGAWLAKAGTKHRVSRPRTGGTSPNPAHNARALVYRGPDEMADAGGCMQRRGAGIVSLGGDRQSGDGQVGGPWSSPGDPGNEVPHPDPEPDDED